MPHYVTFITFLTSALKLGRTWIWTTWLSAMKMIRFSKIFFNNIDRFLRSLSVFINQTGGTSVYLGCFSLKTTWYRYSMNPFDRLSLPERERYSEKILQQRLISLKFKSFEETFPKRNVFQKAFYYTIFHVWQTVGCFLSLHSIWYEIFVTANCNFCNKDIYLSNI